MTGVISSKVPLPGAIETEDIGLVVFKIQFITMNMSEVYNDKDRHVEAT